MELAKNLTRLCQERGLPLSTLARLSGVKQPTLFGWSTGRAVHNLDDLRKALAIFHRTLIRHYEYKARIHNLKNPKAGAITVVQRFGGALNLNVHFHTIYIDGVFFENSFGDEVFFEFVPTHEEVVQLNGTLKKRLMRLLEKFEQVENDYNDQSDFQAQCVQNRDENFQLPLKIGKVWDPPFREFVGKRCSSVFTVHSGWGLEKAGLSDRFSGTHILRHSMATLTRMVTGSLDSAQAVTGHKDSRLV